MRSLVKQRERLSLNVCKEQAWKVVGVAVQLQTLPYVPAHHRCSSRKEQVSGFIHVSHLVTCINLKFKAKCSQHRDVAVVLRRPQQRGTRGADGTRSTRRETTGAG
ncbi:hypothetical protein BaRGS_00007140 [Batillaria attramentaria]|uniref:Uncharacterized protein n=1 Tax=Batillaria attramentaria TaxID=370345 RepID=A0ABD0LPV6_9CAEN